ncbi:MAG: aminotransferase class IV [Bythopirellula sp.]
MPNESQAYWNGQWIPSRDIAISPDDLGFTMGISLVEKLRTMGGQLYHTDRHLTRLRGSLEIAYLDSKRLGAEVESALDEFIDRNRALIEPGDDWSVGVFVTPGDSLSATNPTVCVYGLPIPFQNWATQFEHGLDAVIVSVRELPANVWPLELKCRSRMHYYLADQEARSQHPEARAILLDQDGYICQGSTANVVAYFEGRGLVTPKRTKVLPGVTQGVLYEIADSLGIKHSEADMLPKEFAAADELYFSSTSSCLLPMGRLDGQAVGDGSPGPLFQQLMAAWSKLVGVDIIQQALRFGSLR